MRPCTFSCDIIFGMSRSEKGFTLIEMVTLIVIIAILSFVFITKFSFLQSKLTAAKVKLMSDMRYAQSLAISRGQTFGLEFNPATETYSLYESTPATKIKDPLDPATDFIVNYSTSRAFKGVDIVSANFDGSVRLEFDWKGVPHSGGGGGLSSEGTVVLQGGTNSATVRVATETGRIFH